MRSRREDPFKKIGMGIACFLVVMLIVVGIWAAVDEAKHCTKWETEEYKTMDCVYWSKSMCYQYRETKHTRDVCVARDDR